MGFREVGLLCHVVNTVLAVVNELPDLLAVIFDTS